MNRIGYYWQWAAASCCYLGYSAFGKEFSNLDFNGGQRYYDGRAANLPGWTISYNGISDTERNPLLADGSPLVGVDIGGSLSGRPTFVSASNTDGISSPLPFPNYYGNTFITLGHNTAWLDWQGGGYVSISQSADLKATDKYLWFYKSDGKNLGVLANGKPVSFTTGEFMWLVTGESYYPYTIADLSEFAGKTNVTIEFRYTTPVQRISNDDRSGLGVQIDELFFAPTNVPEPPVYALLGFGGMILMMKLISSKKARLGVSVSGPSLMR